MGSLLDMFKPSPGVAALRLRHSLVCLVGVNIFIAMSPLPSLFQAVSIWFQEYDSSDEVQFIARLISGIELFAVGVLLLTSSQAVFAIKFPRKETTAPPRTPMKAPTKPQTPRRLSPLSPNTTPQTQKTYSPNVSLSRSMGKSRGSTPGPSPLAAYAGKHSDAGLGRSLDGSFIRRVAAEASDDEE